MTLPRWFKTSSLSHPSSPLKRQQNSFAYIIQQGIPHKNKYARSIFSLVGHQHDQSCSTFPVCFWLSSLCTFPVSMISTYEKKKIKKCVRCLNSKDITLVLACCFCVFLECSLKTYCVPTKSLRSCPEEHWVQNTKKRQELMLCKQFAYSEYSRMCLIKQYSLEQSQVKAIWLMLFFPLFHSSQQMNIVS